MALITVYFHKDDLQHGWTNVSVINKLKAKKLQRGGRLLDIKEVVDGWMMPNKDALKMILKLKRLYPWVKFDYRTYLDFKQNLLTGKEMIFKFASNLPGLWDAFLKAWKEYKK